VATLPRTHVSQLMGQRIVPHEPQLKRNTPIDSHMVYVCSQAAGSQIDSQKQRSVCRKDTMQTKPAASSQSASRSVSLLQCTATWKSNLRSVNRCWKQYLHSLAVVSSVRTSCYRHYTLASLAVELKDCRLPCAHRLYTQHTASTTKYIPSCSHGRTRLSNFQSRYRNRINLYTNNICCAPIHMCHQAVLCAQSWEYDVCMHAEATWAAVPAPP
jgi:hypothetical protein